MIEAAWDEYRGWAARSKELQDDSRKWNRAALVSSAVAAIFGAAATQAAGTSFGQALTLAAAVAAALTPVIGQEILASRNEAKWIRCRATAEAIKSECYRFAARSGEYAGEHAANKFFERREALVADAVKDGVSLKNNPAGEGPTGI